MVPYFLSTNHELLADLPPSLKEAAVRSLHVAPLEGASSNLDGELVGRHDAVHGVPHARDDGGVEEGQAGEQGEVVVSGEKAAGGTAVTGERNKEKMNE